MFGLVVYTETPGGECEREAEEVITFHTLLAATSPSEPQDPLLPEDQMIQVRGTEGNIVNSVISTTSSNIYCLAEMTTKWISNNLPALKEHKSIFSVKTYGRVLLPMYLRRYHLILVVTVERKKKSMKYLAILYQKYLNILRRKNICLSYSFLHTSRFIHLSLVT